jgi:hypothetical protein
MSAQIRPTRLEVSDRFPMLGFAIRADANSRAYEIAIGTDPTLFTADGKTRRTRNNFYSTRAQGPLPLSRDETVFLVPPEALVRFAGQGRLYFGLATFNGGGAARPDVATMPTSDSPYVSLRPFTGRTLSRVRLLPSRQQLATGYGKSGADLEWSGDTAAPGTKSVSPEPAARPNGNGAATATPPSAVGAASLAYDDGYGPLPAGDDGTDDGIDEPVPENGAAPLAQSRAFGGKDEPSEYPQASRFAPAAPVNYHAGNNRTIDKVVIHITDGGSKIGGTIGWFQNPNQKNSKGRPIHVSAHYVVGQDGEVVQMVHHTDVAHHAHSANKSSIGIEHVANTRGLNLTPAQYCASAALVRWLCDTLDIPVDRDHVLGHSEADPKTTHTDCPNALWDWDYFMRMVQDQVCEEPGTAAQALGDQGTLAPGDVVKAAGKTYVVYPDEVRAGGVYAWINRNPGNITSGAWAEEHGAYPGKGNGGFAIFPDEHTGFYAIIAFLDRVPNDTIYQVMARYAPPDDGKNPMVKGNNPEAYARMVASRLGATVTTKVKELSDEQKSVWAAEIQRIETGPKGEGQRFAYDDPNLPAEIRDRLPAATESGAVVDSGVVSESGAGHGNGGVAIAQAVARKTAPRPKPRVAKARALEGESFSLNWDGVELVAQPTDMSCWATTAAMIIGWHDQMSISPDYLAQISGCTTATGLDPAAVGKFASDVGLVSEAPACYAIDGFRGLLEQYGPLWIGAAVPSLHVIAVTGLYGGGAADGSDTFVRITDPWDRVTGTPGQAGPYLNTHQSGSRYILKWDDFVKEYEGAAESYPSVNLQILHLPDPGPNKPNYGKPADYAMGLSRTAAARRAGTKTRSRALENESFSINWDDVTLVAQPTGKSCWATSAAMLLTWRDGSQVTPDDVAKKTGFTDEMTTGLYPKDNRSFAASLGLLGEPPQSYTIDGFRDMLERYGPLWLAEQENAERFVHAIVVTGMYSDGAPDGSDTYLRITDPWDRDVGTPGTPGHYQDTHATGSRYIISWSDFVTIYEARITTTSDGTVNLQILHAGDTGGREPNRLTPGAGYAMASGNGGARKPAPPPAALKRGRAKAMVAPAVVEGVVAIGGVALERVLSNEGDVTWDLDQFRGLKHPNDTVPTPALPFKDAPTITLDEWPVAGGLVDDISAWFSIDWQYNGKSLGNVRIENVGQNDAIGWGLAVRAKIMDDNILYPPNDCAALRVSLSYRFTRSIGSDVLAITELHLYGDGTYDQTGRWVQADAI